MPFKTTIPTEVEDRLRAVTEDLRAFLNEQRQTWEAQPGYSGDWHPRSQYGCWLDNVQNAVIALEELEYRFLPRSM